MRSVQDLLYALDQMNAGDINGALVIDDGTLEGLPRSPTSSGSSHRRQPGGLNLDLFEAHRLADAQTRRRYAT